MGLLQLLTGALKATSPFFLLIFVLEAIGLLSMPVRAYTPFGILTAYVFFVIMIWQLPTNHDANNKTGTNNNNPNNAKSGTAEKKSGSNEKVTAKAVG